MLAQNVRRIREALGLTQQQLAASMGTYQPRISEIEGGRVRSPRIGTLELLARTLGVSVSALVEGPPTAEIDPRDEKFSNPKSL